MPTKTPYVAKKKPGDPDTWSCPKCGDLIPWRELFCTTCGTAKPKPTK